MKYNSVEVSSLPGLDRGTMLRQDGIFHSITQFKKSAIIQPKLSKLHIVGKILSGEGEGGWAMAC